MMASRAIRRALELAPLALGLGPLALGLVPLALGLVLAQGCAGRQHLDEGARAELIEAEVDPGPLLAHDVWPVRAFWRQRVTAIWEDGQESFDAVLQHEEDALSLIGLSPMGPPAFVVRHDAAGVEVTNHSDRSLPFAPSFMIADVQKAFYPWLPLEGAPEDGERSGEVQGLRVTERYEEGALVERTFVRADDPEARAFRVRYTGSVAGLAPATAVLDNGWFGYTLRVQTLEAQALD